MEAVLRLPPLIRRKIKKNQKPRTCSPSPSRGRIDAASAPALLAGSLHAAAGSARPGRRRSWIRPPRTPSPSDLPASSPAGGEAPSGRGGGFHLLPHRHTSGPPPRCAYTPHHCAFAPCRLAAPRVAWCCRQIRRRARCRRRIRCRARCRRQICCHARCRTPPVGVAPDPASMR